jgi:hypothetical protein
MNLLLEKLEVALLRRNPGMATALHPGAKETKIRKDLKRAGFEGLIDPLVELYCWHDGCQLHGQTPEAQVTLREGFTPPVVSQPSEGHLAELKRICEMARKPFDPNTKIYTSFHLLPLRTAIVYSKSLKSSPKPQLSSAAGRYFAVLWNGSNDYLALDTDPSAGGRVVMILAREEQPLREAYDSFDDFLTDLIVANQKNERLACIRNAGRVIEASTRVGDGEGTRATKRIPETDGALFLRTDFSDEAAWKWLKSVIEAGSDDEFGPNVEFTSDRAFEGVTAGQLRARLPDDSPMSFAFIADRTAMSHPDWPILVVGLYDDSVRTFRVIAKEIAMVQNNLSTANLDFAEIAKAVDGDGILRAFS